MGSKRMRAEALFGWNCLQICALVNLYSSVLNGLMCSSLESKLNPEHFLRLCLEHDWNSVASRLPKNANNFYKKDTVVEKLAEEVVNDAQHLRRLISTCEAHRQVGETSLNDRS